MASGDMRQPDIRFDLAFPTLNSDIYRKVREDERGKGYATCGLALAVEEARSIIPEDEVYLSCNRNNPASLRVMLKNGAYIHHEDDEEYYTRIPLK